MARFRIDPDRSRVWIDARTNLHSVHAEATGLEGFIEAEVSGGRLDLSTPPRARVELAVDRIQSGNTLFDSELQRRVESRHYPTIVGEATAVTPVGQDRYRVRGEVAFHGVTRTVEGEVRLSDSDGAALLVEGEETFDIRDFGLEPPKLLLLRAYPDVRVRVRIEAEREG